MSENIRYGIPTYLYTIIYRDKDNRQQKLTIYDIVEIDSALDKARKILGTQKIESISKDEG